MDLLSCCQGGIQWTVVAVNQLQLFKELELYVFITFWVQLAFGLVHVQ